MNKYLVLGLMILSSTVYADTFNWGRTYNGAGITTNEGTISVSSTSVSPGVGITVTLSTPTAKTNEGAGFTNYLTDIHMEMYATATVSGSSTPVTCTTSNLPGNPVFKFPTAVAIGTVTFYNIDYVFPLRSSTATTQTQVICPATTSIIWNLSMNGYVDN